MIYVLGVWTTSVTRTLLSNPCVRNSHGNDFFSVFVILLYSEPRPRLACVPPSPNFFFLIHPLRSLPFEGLGFPGVSELTPILLRPRLCLLYPQTIKTQLETTKRVTKMSSSISLTRWIFAPLVLRQLKNEYIDQCMIKYGLMAELSGK